MDEIAQHLDELRDRGLHRKLRLISGPQGARVLLDGKPVLLLCSNNYLGLADHPRVREAAADAAMRWGAGAGASRLVSGNMTVHRRLEEQLAEFKRSEACLLFGVRRGLDDARARRGVGGGGERRKRLRGPSGAGQSGAFVEQRLGLVLARRASEPHSR